MSQLRGVKRNSHVFKDMSVEMATRGNVNSANEIRVKIHNWTNKYRQLHIICILIYTYKSFQKISLFTETKRNQLIPLLAARRLGNTIGKQIVSSAAIKALIWKQVSETKQKFVYQAFRWKTAIFLLTYKFMYIFFLLGQLYFFAFKICRFSDQPYSNASIA